MILRCGKQFYGPKAISNDEDLCNENEVAIEKEVSSPLNDVLDDMNDANGVFKDPEQSSPKPFTSPLPFPQTIAKAKHDLQFGKS